MIYLWTKIVFVYFYLLKQLVEAIKMLFLWSSPKGNRHTENLEEEFLNNCLDFRNDSMFSLLFPKSVKLRLIIHFMSQTDKEIYYLTIHCCSLSSSTNDNCNEISINKLRNVQLFLKEKLNVTRDIFLCSNQSRDFFKFDFLLSDKSDNRGVFNWTLNGDLKV